MAAHNPAHRACVDGVLLEWGAVLYRDEPTAKFPDERLAGGGLTANAIRAHIKATVSRVPQVMVKITGGAQGMVAFKRHIAYITKNGRLPMQDEEGIEHTGSTSVQGLAETWQLDGTSIPEYGWRREVLQVEAGMPAGTEADALLGAAREFAAAEFGGHRWATVLHTHQKHPHIHIIVRMQGHSLERLDPRIGDLHRWRQRFVQALQARGIEAQATRRQTRGVLRPAEEIWRVRAREEKQQLRTAREPRPAISSDTAQQVLEARRQVHNALARSEDPADRDLARQVKAWLRETPMVRRMAVERYPDAPERQPLQQARRVRQQHAGWTR